MTYRHSFSAGFTLIEMIIVITITGIIAGMVAVFIAKPVEGYADSVRRAELTDQADVALRRITRDVRLALPNSLREVVANQSFEFIMTKSGGRYRDPADGSTSGNFLDFTGELANPCGSDCFDVLGAFPEMNGGDLIAVYNLGPGSEPGDAYTLKNVGTLGGGGAINVNPVSLSSNPFKSQSPPLPSPSARFQVIDQNQQVIRYVCDGQQLTRNVYSLATLATAMAPDSSARLAGNVGGEPGASCVISYTPAVYGRSGLLYIELRIEQAGERVTLFQQIHVDNVP